VIKPQQGMAEVDRSAYVTATITLRGQKIRSATEWISDKRVEVQGRSDVQSASVRIAPGGVSIIEFRTSP